MNEQDQFFLESASIPRAMMHLCIPMILAMSAGVIYSIINAFFIGMLNDTTLLAAITFGLPIMALGMAIAGVFGVGGGTYISRLLGEKNPAVLKHVSAFSLYASILAGVVIAAVCLAVINPLVTLIGADAASFEPTKVYISFLLLFLPATIAAAVMEQMVRSIGAARPAMNAMLLSVGANIAFDVLLILGLHWSVAGAAISAGLASMVSIAYLVWFVRRTNRELSVAVQDVRVTAPIVKQVFSIGASEFIMASFMVVTAIVFNNLAAQYGDALIAAVGVSQRLVQVPETLFMGVIFGVMALLGYAYGAKNGARLKEALQDTVLVILGIVAVFSTTMFVFREQIFGLFSSSPEVIALGGLVMGAMLVSTLFNGFTALLLSYFQTTNKAFQTTVLSILQGLLFLPVALAAHALWGLNGMIWSLTMTEATVCLVGLVMFVLSKNKFGQVGTPELVAVNG